MVLVDTVPIIEARRSILGCHHAQPTSNRPLVIVGAGPIGLAAAAQRAVERGLTTVVLEAGPGRRRGRASGATSGCSRPGRELVDPAAEALLDGRRSGGRPTTTPTRPAGSGRDAYLRRWPTLLDASDEVEVRYDAPGRRRCRAGRDRMVDSGREDEPFTVHVETPTGTQRSWPRAVVDASGTWTAAQPTRRRRLPRPRRDASTPTASPTASPTSATRPSPRGTPASTSQSPASGASAQDVLVGLTPLAEERRRGPGSRGCCAGPPSATRSAVATTTSWRQRGALGQQRAGPPRQRPGHRRHPVPHRARSPPQAGGRLTLVSVDGQQVDRRRRGRRRHRFPTRLHVPVRGPPRPRPGARRRRARRRRSTRTTTSCGDVVPARRRELAQPEQGLYLVGMKSYGRAPSFLAMTGYEQVR